MKWLTVLLAVVTAGCPSAPPPPPPPPPPATALQFLGTPDPVVGVPFQIQVGGVAASGVATSGFTGGVTLALAGGPPGAKLLPASPTTNAVNGVATFSGISIDTPGSGYTLVATAAGLTGATSVPFDVSAPPTQLAFVSPVLGFVATARTPFDAQVRALDGQSQPANFDGQVTLALAANPNGGVLGGTVSVAAVKGVASFSGLTIDKAGAGYTLLASATGLAGGATNPFDVLPDPPDHLVFVSPVSGFTVPAGSPFEVKLQAVDIASQPTSYTGMVALSLSPGSPAGALSGGAAVAAVNGVVTFPSVSIDTAGNGFKLDATSTLPKSTSDAFDVTASVCAISPAQPGVLILPTGSAGFAYPTQQLSASGCGTGLTWSISGGSLPAGLSISPTTGAISGTTTTVQVGVFTVKVVGSGGTATQQYEILVVSGCVIEPSLTPGTEYVLGNGTAGSPFSLQLQATPGCGTGLAWAVSAGALPAGLSLGAATGLVNGTPTTAGTAHFTAMVTGSAGQGSQQYALTIGTCSIIPPPVPSAAPYALLPGLQNEAYIPQLFLAIGSCGRVNAGGWQVTAGALPTGSLALDPDFGQLTGTPNQTGTFTFTITATASGGTAHQSYSLTINPATSECVLQPGLVPPSNTLAFPDVHLNQFAQRMVAASSGCDGIDNSGGKKPFTISAGALPAGMQINSNGAINGTPTQLGANTFTVEVTGATGKTAFQAYSLNVVP